MQTQRTDFDFRVSCSSRTVSGIMALSKLYAYEQLALKFVSTLVKNEKSQTLVNKPVIISKLFYTGTQYSWTILTGTTCKLFYYNFHKMLRILSENGFLDRIIENKRKNQPTEVGYLYAGDLRADRRCQYKQIRNSLQLDKRIPRAYGSFNEKSFQEDSVAIRCHCNYFCTVAFSFSVSG